jgi:hypothetical protein
LRWRTSGSHWHPHDDFANIMTNRVSNNATGESGAIIRRKIGDDIRLLD